MDSLQLMIEAAGGLNGQHRKLTDEEITGNAFVFILAGFEKLFSYLLLTMRSYTFAKTAIRPSVTNLFPVF